MAKIEQEKITIRLFRGDKDKLSNLFPEVGYNKAIRFLVRNFIKSIEEKAQSRLGQNKTPDIEIDLSLEE
jgi:hypothetical protein